MKRKPFLEAISHGGARSPLRICIAASLTFIVGSVSAKAMEFSLKRKCDFIVPGREHVRKVCYLSGTADRTGVDFQVETPDGGRYSIQGHREGDQLVFFLDGRLASAQNDCYARLDHNLTLCFGERVD
jgi:hypothetical protein